MIRQTVIFGPGYDDDRIKHLEKIIKLKPKYNVRVDVTDYRIIGNDIWNDKFCQDDLVELLGDKKFYEWFKKVYILKEKSDIEEERFNYENTISKSKR